MIHKHRVLVIDDEPIVCDVVKEMIQVHDGFRVIAESDPARALALLKSSQFDLVLTDLMMGDYSGMQMIEAALERSEETIVVLMTGYPTMENAIDALKHGAYDYIVKPFKLDNLLATIERGLRKQMLARENIHLKEQLALFKIAEAMGSTIHLGSALNQVLRLTIKEFNADGASILFYEQALPTKFILQAIQTVPDVAIDRPFLEGKTRHSQAAAESRVIEIENIYFENPAIHDAANQARVESLLSCPLLVRGRVLGLLNIARNSLYREFSTGELQCLKVIASKAAYAISNSKLYDDLEKAYLSTIMALANAVEARDRYTSGHTVRVTYLAELIAKELDWDDERIFTLTMGCSLHDIGKIGVPDSILNKPGRLTDQERVIMQRHTEVGARMIEGIPFLKPCLPYITSHHEQWDGSGYPVGQKAEDIPIEGRILAVADTFDAIVTDRPYRRGKSIEAAVQELKDFAGRQFDPQVVDIFIEAIQKSREKLDTIYNFVVDLDQQPAASPTT